MKSESIAELAKALSKAQGDFDHAKKDSAGPFAKSFYADLANVIDAAKKPLADNGLAVSQIIVADENGNVNLETILMHASGEWISGTYPVRPVKTDPQSMGSAITYARRYSFSAITGIAADDDDGNEASKPKPDRQRVDKPIEKSYWPQDKFNEKKEEWKEKVFSGERTVEQLLTVMQVRHLFTESQILEIQSWER